MRPRVRYNPRKGVKVVTTRAEDLIDGKLRPGVFRCDPRVASYMKEHQPSFCPLTEIAAASKAAFFEALRAPFRFPDYFGRNWDAFLECMRFPQDVPFPLIKPPGVVILWERWRDFADGEPEEFFKALECLNDVVDFWWKHKTLVYVLLVDEVEATDPMWRSIPFIRMAWKLIHPPQ